METGRPPKYENVEQLEKAIEDYFQYIKGEFHFEQINLSRNKKTDAVETPILQKVWDREPEPPTITGLALYLGFVSRQSIYDYEKNGDYSYTIKKARLRIEANYEKSLSSSSPTGAIFALKNFGWADKQQIDHTSNDKELLNQTLDYSKLSDAALREISNLKTVDSRSEGSKD